MRQAGYNGLRRHRTLLEIRPMRWCAAVLVAVVATTGFADEPVKPLTPADAAKKINEKCTVEMEVKSVGMPSSGKVVFLNSEEDFKSSKNFTVMLGEKALDQLKKAKVDDVSVHYKGKTIQVT